MNKSVFRFIGVVIIGWSSILGVYIFSKHYQLQINVSGSMYNRVWLTHLGDMNLKRGDFVVIKFHDYRMKNLSDYELVVKQIGGIGGDEIIVKNWLDYTAGVDNSNKTTWIYILPDGIIYQVCNMLSGYHFTPLTTKNITIPKGYYFLHGQHYPSFDSRYKEFGLINRNQILGRAYHLF